MSFLKCSYCGRRCTEGYAHVYWFAPTRSPEVFRVRQRLCYDCLATNVDALLTPDDAETLTCSACGISVEDDVYAVYVTYYRRGENAFRGAMALCEEHQLEIKVRAAKDASELPDRYVEAPDLAVATPVSATEALHALGRQDQVRRRRG